MEKKEIRKEMLKKREAQAQLTKARRDKAIFRRLIRMKLFRQAKEFFIYLAHRGEVDTDLLIQTYFGIKKIIVPKIENKKICLYELNHPMQFKKGQFGIREPAFCLPRRELEKIKVALIPAIAFDTRGHRIGFGGGYFDRLLKKLDCTTIGLAYEFQIIDKVPTHPYDVAVEYIVTEKRIIICKKLQFNNKTQPSTKSYAPKRSAKQKV